MTLVGLCDEVIAAEWACFEAWCGLVGGGTLPEPGVLVASQQGLHDAAEELRRWCLADPAAAETARRGLLRAQVEGEIKHQADIARRRSRQRREPLRRAWIEERIHLVQSREALAVGLGWPHRGERVVADLMRAESGREWRVSGRGVYMTSNDVYNVGHVVWVPSLGRDRHESTQLVIWQPCMGDECADPAGDIGIRLEGAQERRLPVPMPRWPKPGHVDGGPRLDATVPDGGQLPLFGAWEVR